MTIIYLHGLDSDSNAVKAKITEQAATALGLSVVCPDLNIPPASVVQKISHLIETHPNAVLIGSSLGGYFANLLSDQTGAPAILLNPSIRPDLSFRRFLSDNFKKDTALAADSVIYTTTGGWQIVYSDLAWFEAHKLQVEHPKRLRILLKMGDELLDAHKTRAFYESKGVIINAQDGGDHRISDYDVQVPTVLAWAQTLMTQNSNQA